jgi:ribosomal protein L37AE/L43A
MTTAEIIALAKEKLGKEITEEEAKAYLSGDLPLPDEALELVSGGASCGGGENCPTCGKEMTRKDQGVFYCSSCQFYRIKKGEKNWESFLKCPVCNHLSLYLVKASVPPIYECRVCGYTNHGGWTRRW